MYRKILTERDLRIGQQPGGKRLRSLNAEIVAEQPQVGVVCYHEHRHFGRIQTISGIETMLPQFGQRQGGRVHINTGRALGTDSAPSSGLA